MVLCDMAEMWKYGLILLVLLHTISYCESVERPCDRVSSTTFDLKENTKLDVKVTEIKFRGPSDKITTRADDHEYLRYDPADGVVYSKKPLDAESVSSVPNLMVYCTEKGDSVSIDYSYFVSIKDVNEFPPKFEEEKYQVTITEAVNVGTTIFGSIVAKDADATKTTLITYSIVPESDYFEIPVSTKGEVVLKKKLELDDNVKIILKLQAIDDGDPRLSNTSELVVSVVDLDDEPPVFTKSSYTGTIPVGATMGDTVTMTNPVSATDGDKGLNAEVEYSIDSGPGIKSYFEVDKTTGVVTLASLGLTAGERHVVVIKAAQKNAPTKRFAMVQLIVTVEDTGGSPVQLVFNQAEYACSIPENHPPGGDICTVHAESTDKNAVITYRIVEPTKHQEFTIENDSGRTSLAARAELDFEKKQKYEFQVKATAASKEIIAKVTINILNINDNDPKFTSTKYNFRVSEPSKGKKIGTVTANDADGDQCTYSVRSYSDVFTVLPTGDVTLLVGEKDLKQGNFVFVIGCTDNGQPPRQGTTIVDTIIGNGTAKVVGAGQAGEMDILPLIILAVLCGILLFIIIVLVIYIQKRGAELKREKAHKQNISNLSIFGDSSTNLNDDGATTVQENPLALENPGYFYMMKSETDSSPTNDYLVSEVRYPDSNYAENGGTLPGSQNGTLPNRGKRVKIQDDKEPDPATANGQPADPKITVYF